MNKQNLISFITVVLLLFLLPLFAKICMEEFVSREFDANTEDKIVMLKPDNRTFEKPMSFTLYPWSKYKKKDICELSAEQKAFVKEKKLAECMVDITNYDSTFIRNKDTAAEILYDDIRNLKTEEGDEYFVWYRSEVENIYIFAMANMDGNIFSFHFVTDIEYTHEDALEYVLENFEESENELSNLLTKTNFKLNQETFLNNTKNILAKYQNIDSNLFNFNTVVFTYPNKITSESGNILITYATNFEDENYIYLYLDNQTKKFSGYQIGFK